MPTTIPSAQGYLFRSRRTAPGPIRHAVTKQMNRTEQTQMLFCLTAAKHQQASASRTSVKTMLTSHFLYRVGGALTWNDPTYIERSADTELAQALRAGTFAYVLAPRQMGKSSLRIRTRYQLTQQGYQCVTIQATQLMDHHMYISHYTPDAADSHRQNRWCAALISIIWSELKIGRAHV